MAAIALYTFGLLHEEHDHPRNISFQETAQDVYGHAEDVEGFM